VTTTITVSAPPVRALVVVSGARGKQEAGRDSSHRQRSPHPETVACSTAQKLADSPRTHDGKEHDARTALGLAHVCRSRLLPGRRLQHHRRPRRALQGRGLRRRDIELLAADHTAWGWFFFVVGLLRLAAGTGIFQWRGWGRLLGILLAALSAMLDIAFLVAFPAFGAITIALSVLVIYGLIVPDERNA
jgi:hypothetical protein